jgi:D-alanyl-D-alanine carboxypeptidase
MKNKILLIIFSVVTQMCLAQSVSDSMLLFFKNHPKTTSFFAIKNNAIISAYNETEIMPMANMADLLVAMEFAKQATYKIIDTAERINLKEIVKYYFENANVDAYEDWLSAMLVQKKVDNNKVALIEVCYGMLHYGVMANTEFLMDKLGFDNIKSSLQSYNLKDHEAIMPPVGALALYQNRTNISEKKMLKAINDMGEEEYCKMAFVMHNAIKYDSTFKNKIPKQLTTEKVLQMWSYRLPGGSAKSYATLLQTVLQEKMLDAKYYKMLRVILEAPLKNNNVQNLYDRFGTKNSTTPSVIAKAQFGKLKNGDEVVFVYSCSNLNAKELTSIKNWQALFDNDITTNVIVQNKARLLKTPVAKK